MGFTWNKNVTEGYNPDILRIGHCVDVVDEPPKIENFFKKI